MCATCPVSRVMYISGKSLQSVKSMPDSDLAYIFRILKYSNVWKKIKVKENVYDLLFIDLGGGIAQWKNAYYWCWRSYTRILAKPMFNLQHISPKKATLQCKIATIGSHLGTITGLLQKMQTHVFVSVGLSLRSYRAHEVLRIMVIIYESRCYKYINYLQFMCIKLACLTSLSWIAANIKITLLDLKHA